MTRDEYRQEREDGRWLRRRFDILCRDDCRCVRCGNDQEICDVHHNKRYVDGRHAWEYADDELETLCRSCHAREHGICEVFRDVNALCSERWEERKRQVRMVKASRFIEALAKLSNAIACSPCTQADIDYVEKLTHSENPQVRQVAETILPTMRVARERQAKSNADAVRQLEALAQLESPVAQEAGK